MTSWLNARYLSAILAPGAEPHRWEARLRKLLGLHSYCLDDWRGEEASGFAPLLLCGPREDPRRLLGRATGPGVSSRLTSAHLDDLHRSVQCAGEVRWEYSPLSL